MAMELHPFLETDIRPAPNWWYVMSAAGESPTMRVGHSATFVPALHPGESDRVFVIGGANPSQVFDEVFVFDLKTRSWDTLEAAGFRGRYEHSAVRVRSKPDKIFVFGGATQEGNLNDVQCLDVSAGQWSDVETSGEAPSPRTNRSAVAIGDKIYVYSGGKTGAEPVADRKVYCLETDSMTWSTLSPRGDSPKPRHGHIMVPLGNKIYLHGGMSGATFYDDLHILDVEKNSWSNVKKKRSNPPPRAAHEGLGHQGAVYMFGGMSGAGALDDGYKLNTETNSWSRLEFEGPSPANRLDFAMCAVSMAVPEAREDGAGSDPKETSDRVSEVMERELKPGSASSRESVSESTCVDEAVYALDTDPTYQGEKLGADILDAVCGDSQSSPQEVKTEDVVMVMVNGGMDTEGEIFDDTLVLLL